jgi:DNA repair exonuclease SbcCD ATPase subunit
MSDTPETDAFAEMAHNLVLDWDCRDSGDTTEKPLVVTAEFARRLERERDEARKEAAMWKANHDNQVELKSIISKRGDLKDRAPRVEKLIAERDQLRQVIRDVHRAFPDLAEFQDKNGRSLKWLADKIQKAKGDA